MSNFILPPPCRASLLIFLIAGGALSTFAEPRTFTNSQGRKIVAEPVSLGGDGTLDLKREDGNLFQIKISDLSLDDQQFLREWTVANPPKIDYRFMIRIKDKNGKVVQEFISPNASMKGKTWDTVPASLEIKASE